jgi:hypothetical protein
LRAPQAHGLDFGLGQQGAGEGLGLGVGHGDLEAVFAGVAAARDEKVGAVPGEAAAGHEHQLPDTGHEARERRNGLRALQREQGAFGHRDDLAAMADVGLDVRDVADLAGAVDDHEEVFTPVDEHQVVNDRAFIGQQQTVTLFAHGQVDHVHRHQGLERGGGVRADQAQLAHVRDVEQAGGPACVVVLGHQAGGVLHRHGVAGKRHHARTEFDVQRVQRGGEQSGLGCGHGILLKGQKLRARVPVLPSLSALPERFAGPALPGFGHGGRLRFAPSVDFAGASQAKPLSSEETPFQAPVSPFA